MINKIFLSLIASIAFVANAAHAAPIKYDFTGPTFNSANGVFTSNSKITGFIAFDTSVLSANGTGLVETTSNGIAPGVTWQFSDGFNTFNNTLTANNFQVSVYFNNYVATAWVIDATFGWTNRDIWIQGNSTYISLYDGSSASGGTITSANWNRVPEPGSLALFGLGLMGLAALRRRKL